MTFDISHYCTGYSIGVGGLVLHGKKVLLVRRGANGSPGASTWALPGGFVERNEPLDVAVRREVLEETGIEAQVESLIAVLNRVFDDRNDTYFILLMRANGTETQADGSEVDDARFFTMVELQNLPDLQPLSRLVTIPALQGRISGLNFLPNPHISPNKGILYAGEGIREQQEILLEEFRRSNLGRNGK